LWQTLTSREFRPLRMAVLMQFVFLYVVGHLGYIVFHNYAAPVYTATYTWIQSSWAGNVSTTATGVHPGNQTGWNYFASKDTEIVISGGAVTLELPTSLQTETTDTHFNAGAKTNVFTSSTGSGASIVLLKPGGATCSTGTQCTSGICTTNICYVPPCGVGVTSTLYSSETYPLVNIGTQCWFAKNLNVGTKLASAATVPSNGSLIEKWCYDNSDANCTTYGGLYTWAEALQLDPTCNTSNSGGCIPGANRQGICPSGWHIPTDAEIKTLEVYLGMCTGGGAGCVDATSWRGTDQSTQLKTGGSSGFNLPLGAGRRSTGNAFQGQGTYTYMWSGSASTATDAWYRQFTTRADLFRDVLNKAYGSSVRCVKDA
nr:fibrobacter succinogenes major paralogous domain-containing protein [Candidatus Magasanikbacteria bacterium]